MSVQCRGPLLRHLMAHQQRDRSVSQEVFRNAAEKTLTQPTMRVGAHYDHGRLLFDRSRNQRRSRRTLVPRAGDQVSPNSMPKRTETMPLIDIGRITRETLALLARTGPGAAAAPSPELSAAVLMD